MKVNFICGPQRLVTIRILSEELHIPLKEAKHCVDTEQFECTEEQFKSIEPKLKEIGNTEFKFVAVCML